MRISNCDEEEEEGKESGLTFNPIHLIVPTSSSANGLNNLPTCATSPVFSPGWRTDEPEKTETLIGSELNEARPTSCSGS
jgi:hypothetical protein